MLGGIEITAKARAHAREMLARGRPSDGGQRQRRAQPCGTHRPTACARRPLRRRTRA